MSKPHKIGDVKLDLQGSIPAKYVNSFDTDASKLPTYCIYSDTSLKYLTPV